MKTRFALAPLLFTCFWLASCESNNERQNTNDGASEKHTNHHLQNGLNDSVQIVTMPTPLQIPSLMKNSDKDYSSAHLLPILSARQTAFKSSILLGSYLFDMSYTGIYSDHQKSLDYMSACADMSEAVGISGNISEREIRRFRQNLSYPDSVASVILELYDRGHQMLINQNKEGHGLLLIMGCYMEGMYLTVHDMRLQDFRLFLHALSLQKDYGKNIELMLSYYEIPEEVKAQYELFSKTCKLLNKYEYPTILEMKEGTKDTKFVDQSLISELKVLTTEFRASMVN